MFIKTYNSVNKQHTDKSFGISRMEDIYEKRKGQVDEPHRHDYFTILLVKDAEGQHIIDFHEYKLSDHQVYFISPGQVHQVIENRSSVGYSMVFSSQFLMENYIPNIFIEDLNLFQDYGQTPPLEVSPQQMEQLNQICEDIIQFYQSNDKFKEQAIGSLIKLFLIHCNNLCTLPYDNTQAVEAGHNILKQFKGLVELNYTEWHATSEYADALNITPDYLNRTVKSLTGKTSKEYIQSKITIEAKRLLFFSGLTNKEIGYELGFSEPANFSAFFKKCVGISPSQFRKSNRSDTPILQKG